MNSSSWFIYLADTIPSLGTFFGTMGIIGLVASLIVWLITTVAWDTRDEATLAAVARFNKVTSVSFFVSAFLVVVHIIIPSKQTFYMIAASESAEVVINNPEVQEIFTDLTGIIKKELKGMTESKEKSN